MAIDYYKNNSVDDDDRIISQLKGIDFNEHVEIRIIDSETKLDQMQASGFGLGEIRTGSYYAYSDDSATAAERGIAGETGGEISKETPPPTLNDVKNSIKELEKKKLKAIAEGKSLTASEESSLTTLKDLETQMKATPNMTREAMRELSGVDFSSIEKFLMAKQTTDFRVVKPIQALVSTAAPTVDTWSQPGEKIPVEGGGTQVYVGNKSKVAQQIKSEHQIAVDKVLDKIKTLHEQGKLNTTPTSLSISERKTLIKQIFILKEKATFLKSQPWGQEMYREHLSSLDKIHTTLDNIILTGINESDIDLAHQLETIHDISEQGADIVRNTECKDCAKAEQAKSLRREYSKTMDDLIKYYDVDGKKMNLDDVKLIAQILSTKDLHGIDVPLGLRVKFESSISKDTQALQAIINARHESEKAGEAITTDRISSKNKNKYSALLDADGLPPKFGDIIVTLKDGTMINETAVLRSKALNPGHLILPQLPSDTVNGILEQAKDTSKQITNKYKYKPEVNATNWRIKSMDKVDSLGNVYILTLDNGQKIKRTIVENNAENKRTITDTEYDENKPNTDGKVLVMQQLIKKPGSQWTDDNAITTRTTLVRQQDTSYTEYHKTYDDNNGSIVFSGELTHKQLPTQIGGKKEDYVPTKIPKKVVRKPVTTAPDADSDAASATGKKSSEEVHPTSRISDTALDDPKPPHNEGYPEPLDSGSGAACPLRR
jgi:hypothetical protein